jgi:gliding motility-associated-like protein
VQPRTTSILEPIITFTNLSTGANFWAWNFGDSLTSFNSDPPPHTYPDTGTYVVTLITSTLFNCWDTTYQNVTIDPDFVFYIPSAFSPNGDGLNETFSGKGIFIEQYQMTIFDRWGNLIYKTSDINKPWDGKAAGGSLIAQNDVYVYSIVVTDTKKNKHYYKGMVTLLK